MFSKRWRFRDFLVFKDRNKFLNFNIFLDSPLGFLYSIESFGKSFVVSVNNSKQCYSLSSFVSNNFLQNSLILPKLCFTIMSDAANSSHRTEDRTKLMFHTCEGSSALWGLATTASPSFCYTWVRVVSTDVNAEFTRI